MKRVQSDQDSGKPVITPIDRQVASISHSFVSDPDATHDATQTFGNNVNCGSSSEGSVEDGKKACRRRYVVKEKSIRQKNVQARKKTQKNK